MATKSESLASRRFVLLLLGTTVLTLLLLTACGQVSQGPAGGATAAPAQQTQKPAATTAPPTQQAQKPATTAAPPTQQAQKPAETAKPAGDTIDACTVVTKAEAEEALGVTVNQVERPPEAPFGCRYIGPKGQGLAVLVVLVTTGPPSDVKIGFEVMKEGLEDVVEGVETVDGLGDQAFLLYDQVHVLRGGTYLVVSGDASPEALKSLAQKALARLP